MNEKQTKTNNRKKQRNIRPLAGATAKPRRRAKAGQEIRLG